MSTLERITSRKARIAAVRFAIRTPPLALLDDPERYVR